MKVAKKFLDILKLINHQIDPSTELSATQIEKEASPWGAHRVIPLRVYEDIEAAQRFLVDVFGFKQGRLIRDPNGRPFHAEVHTGDSVIWIHRVDPEHGMVSARSLPAQPAVSLSSSTM